MGLGLHLKTSLQALLSPRRSLEGRGLWIVLYSLHLMWNWFCHWARGLSYTPEPLISAGPILNQKDPSKGHCSNLPTGTQNAISEIAAFTGLRPCFCKLLFALWGF